MKVHTLAFVKTGTPVTVVVYTAAILAVVWSGALVAQFEPVPLASALQIDLYLSNEATEDEAKRALSGLFPRYAARYDLRLPTTIKLLAPSVARMWTEKRRIPAEICKPEGVAIVFDRSYSKPGEAVEALPGVGRCFVVFINPTTANYLTPAHEFDHILGGHTATVPLVEPIDHAFLDLMCDVHLLVGFELPRLIGVQSTQFAAP